ncbi:MAG: MATE family efflux transporter [Pseudomonadota bacterium]
MSPTPQKDDTAPPRYADVLRLAWPASVAASVTPLLGVVDVWALSQSARPLDVAAVGLGSVIFSLAYWTFGFIRMSVAGLTAQASGAGDRREERAGLLRGALIGAVIGFLLVILQGPVGLGAFHALAIGSDATAETFSNAHAYYAYRIWGAPFALATYALLGWLTAKGRTDFLMATSLAMTVLNGLLDYWFVTGLNMGAAGVAAGTLIAEIAGFVFAALFILSMLKREGGLAAHWRTLDLFEVAAMRRTLSVNRDIFIRTLLLAFSFAWFVQRGGAFGDATLAGNQILLQLLLFTGLALDGTAIAAETLVGRAIGDRDRTRGKARLQAAIRKTFIPALIAAGVFMAFYATFGSAIIDLLTAPGPVRSAAKDYLFWIVISPAIVVAGFQLDGIFIGATKARHMRDSMIMSVLIFIPLSLPLATRFGNHGLWFAFSVYFIIRAATLGWYLYRGAIADTFAHDASDQSAAPVASAIDE